MIAPPAADRAPGNAPGPATIPAHLLYWGRLPAVSSGPSAQRLRYRFERLLPVPVEQVHVATAALSDGAVLLIGIEHERLRAHLAGRGDLGPDTWMLVPDAAPAHLAAAGVVRRDLDRLNLLCGPFEPAPRRRLRLLGVALVHAGLAAALALVAWGAERRAQAHERHAEAVQHAVQQRVAEALPPQPGAAIRPELRLTMELRSLEQAARSPGAGQVDVAAVLERLWAFWPPGLRVQADTISASAERIVLRGTVPGLADAEHLAKGCADLAAPGWRYRADPLQAQSGERGANFLLTLIRQGAPGP